VLWQEHDASVLGRPFYVMERVDGSIPPDNPGHHFVGWVKDLAPREQETLLDSAMAAMASIHRVDWRAAGFAELGDGSLDHDIEWWRRYRSWAGIEVPRIDAAFEWCDANRPPEPEPALVWGDARLGNLIFAPDHSVRAVLDWEMVTLGPPELDLGWYLFLERVVLTFTPQLPGFGDHATITARYEHHLGRSVGHMQWYELWGGVRSALCHHRLAGLRGDAPGFDPVLDTIDGLLAEVR
jgi:aminoglycoside phosphotransferase (APT) family kinase protein